MRISFYEIIVILFAFVLSAVILSMHIRLSWWLDKGCSASESEQKENGTMEWAVWLASIYIALIAIYVIYKIILMIY